MFTSYKEIRPSNTFEKMGGAYMKCQYCNKDMELGLIESKYQIIWTKGDKKKPLINVRVPKGSVILAKQDLKSLLTGCSVKTFLCRSCKKVVIDYSNHDR